MHYKIFLSTNGLGDVIMSSLSMWEETYKKYIKKNNASHNLLSSLIVYLFLMVQ